MRISAALLASLFIFPLAAACGSSNPMDADPFDTLQACYDEHHNMESLSVHDAIVVCCLDHPIAGVHPSCKDTQADCVMHVTTELSAPVSSGAVTAADIQGACTTYIMQK